MMQSSKKAKKESEVSVMYFNGSEAELLARGSVEIALPFEKLGGKQVDVTANPEKGFYLSVLHPESQLLPLFFRLEKEQADAFKAILDEANSNMKAVIAQRNAIKQVARDKLGTALDGLKK
jgi:hypothetical protein